ncbi:MAG: hypothetical protein H6Q54_2044 [Deltaproteobacteria bacterium]|nr:hypothetical protein [Deltaproteobacteria bacterium]
MRKIPKFKSEKEEADFWASHDSTDFLGETKEVKIKFVRPKKKLVSLRLDEKTIKELKKLAQKKGIGYLELVRLIYVTAKYQEYGSLPGSQVS